MDNVAYDHPMQPQSHFLLAVLVCGAAMAFVQPANTALAAEVVIERHPPIVRADNKHRSKIYREDYELAEPLYPPCYESFWLHN